MRLTYRWNFCYCVCFFNVLMDIYRLPRGCLGKEPTCQSRRCGFDSWVEKISCRRKWHPAPVFLPGKAHEQRSLLGYSPWSSKESDTTEHDEPSGHLALQRKYFGTVIVVWLWLYRSQTSGLYIVIRDEQALLWACLVAQWQKKIHLPMQETWFWSLSWEDPLEKEMTTHSSILASEIPWTEEPGGLQVTKSRTQFSN